MTSHAHSLAPPSSPPHRQPDFPASPPPSTHSTTSHALAFPSALHRPAEHGKPAIFHHIIAPFSPPCPHLSLRLKYCIYIQPLNIGGNMTFPVPHTDLSGSEIDLNDIFNIRKHSCFLFRVQGNAMDGIGIMEGDTVVTDRSIPPQNGHVVLGRHRRENHHPPPAKAPVFSPRRKPPLFPHPSRRRAGSPYLGCRHRLPEKTGLTAAATVPADRPRAFPPSSDRTDSIAIPPRPLPGTGNALNGTCTIFRPSAPENTGKTGDLHPIHTKTPVPQNRTRRAAHLSPALSARHRNPCHRQTIRKPPSPTALRRHGAQVSCTGEA